MSSEARYQPWRGRALAAGVAAVTLAVAPIAQGAGTAPTGHVAAFRTPSGNIVCAWHGTYLDCGILSGLRPRAAGAYDCNQADGGDPPRELRLWDIGEVRVVCAASTGVFAYRGSASVLAYGESWSRGGVRCMSRPTALTCTNRNARGFSLSRQRTRIFTGLLAR
jgi:hypothetical protein